MTFIVSDLDRMEVLLTTVLNARKVYDSGDRTFSVSRERSFLVSDGAADPDAPAPIWIATMEGAPLPSPTYNHVAFKIEETDYERCLAAIQSVGLEVRKVDGEGGSIYFHDYDNHLFELHTGTLSERLARYAREL